MKVGVEDAAVLRSIKPLELAAYLRSKGWHLDANLAGKATLWSIRNTGGAEFDVTLPPRREFGDYVLRMGEALRTLADAEQRSALDVLRDIQTTTSDLVRVRAPNRNAEDGALPLNVVVKFVEWTRDMMLAAACAVIDKRSVYASQKKKLAMDYLTNVRMGQTERGSYVLTLLSPVVPQLGPVQDQLFPDEPEDPFERQVTRTLLDSLDALAGAAKDAAVNGNMAPFLMAVKRGVSANLCEAVAGLSKVSPGEGLDVQVSWSPTRPVDISIPTRVTFGSDSIPHIEAAARIFREAAPPDDVTIEGIVTGLDRSPEATEGNVTISASLEGRVRRIMLRLNADTYPQAIQAHKDRRIVQCSGDLVKEGRSYRLKDPRHFEIMPDD